MEMPPEADCHPMANRCSPHLIQEAKRGRSVTESLPRRDGFQAALDVLVTARATPLPEHKIAWLLFPACIRIRAP
jgi:hypothetical protein